jgi:hypothetical protein
MLHTVVGAKTVWEREGLAQIPFHTLHLVGCHPILAY